MWARIFKNFSIWVIELSKRLNSQDIKSIRVWTLQSKNQWLAEKVKKNLSIYKEDLKQMEICFIKIMLR